MSVGIEKRRGKYAAETGAARRKEVKKETETKLDELKKKNSDLESENSELKKQLARYIEAEKADAEAAAQRRAALSLLPEAERQKKVEIALAQAKNRKEMSTMAEDLASVGY